MKQFITVIITLASLVLLTLLFIFSGLFNPSALSRHNKLTLWMINTAKDVSIERRDKNIEVPTLTDSMLIQTGFQHYNEMCIVCHSAPGIDESETAKGLYPHPPQFYKHADRMNVKETFWTIKYGLKMTGMPAYSPTHSDDKIWAMTAFITQKLGKMTPQEYKTWMEKYKTSEEVE